MRRTIGMTLCAVLAIVDLVGIIGLRQHPGPPPGVAITGAVLGGVTLAAYRPADRGDIRALRVVLGSRVVSALLGIPVFFTSDAPNWARIVVAVLIAGAIIAVTMLAPALSPAARPSKAEHA
ncbi:hypothetical protein ABZT04_33010 [Streptomyces sp. NPDC005492]|uniref:hypothetical protein n=1 Tax=Streptomyces sp. NPDC005492 TaxID=3156883 RepID=UPI0033A26E92